MAPACPRYWTNREEFNRSFLPPPKNSTSAEQGEFNTGGTAEIADNFVPVDETFVGFLILEG